MSPIPDDRATAPTSPPDDAQTLWWPAPVPLDAWDQATPLGDGHLGAMVFGGVARERIQLNEGSLWSGRARDRDNREALANLPEVRRLLFGGRPAEAIALANAKLMGEPRTIMPYETLGDLFLDLGASDDDAESYRRELDLDGACARMRCRIGGTTFTREAIASAPARVLAVRLAADRPGAISFTARLERARDATTTATRDGLVLAGALDGGSGLAFRAELRVVAEGGTVATDGAALRVSGADRVTLLLAAATSFRGDDPAAACAARLRAAAAAPWDGLLAAHQADHRALFRRVALRLGAVDPAVARLPTDARLARVQAGADDPGLAALFAQFGRYLLIASSRAGGLPANLQGLWNDSFTPPWNSDFHLNINLQMNYWPAEVANLAECHEPLIDFLETLREPGRRTARVHYGCGGFVAHHITDLWGFTAPGDGAQWGLWPMGAAWLCQHLWEHWRFGGDDAFLARAYPTLREAAEFFLDYLVSDAKGRLVSGPSISPENSYRLPDGTVGTLCMGATMDTEIVDELFAHVIAAGERLGVDPELRARIAAAKAKLPPLAIGKHGQLMEWSEDYDEPEPGHRHISHLFALHPSDRITPRATPALAAAARRTLTRRLENGGGHTGWSRAWIVNFWARLGDGDEAHANLLALLRTSTLPNLWDLHPPFQIDGNFGATAGICELLLQSHDGAIALLPALPTAWREGAFAGLRARGAATVDCAWADGAAIAATIRCARAGTIRVRPPRGQRVASVSGRGALTAFVEDAGEATWTASADATYALAFAPHG